MSWTNTLSRLAGRLADTEFPRPVQRLINGAYVRAAGVDLDEFQPAGTYPSLNALFTRRFATPRPVTPSAGSLVAPADAAVQAYGRLAGDSLLQVKGISYSVRDLLTGHATDLACARDAAYLSLYLSPREYHGYHAPAALHVDRLIHVPGELLPVAPFSVRRVRGLFARNERVVLEARRPSGRRFWMVFVGALNVGSITFEMAPALHTNSGARGVCVYECGGRAVAQGEYLGAFRLGSSILLIAPTRAGAPASLDRSRVRVGEPLPWPPAE